MHKIILLVAVPLFLLSCHINNNSNHNSSLKIVLNSMRFEINKYIIKNEAWYYPYQILYQFKAINYTDKNIIIDLNSITKRGKLKSSDIYIVLSKDTLFLGINKKVYIQANDSAVFYAYLLNSPIFDSIYSSDEFFQYLSYLQNNSRYYINPDYDSSIKKNSQFFKVFPDSKFKVLFYHWKDGKINYEQIGYPSAHIPDSIVPVKPTPGIEY